MTLQIFLKNVLVSLVKHDDSFRKISERRNTVLNVRKIPFIVQEELKFQLKRTLFINSLGFSFVLLQW